jgi:hypothetical protein
LGFPPKPGRPDGILIRMLRAAVGGLRFGGEFLADGSPCRAADVAQMARVNVRCRQETYRGLMSDAILDDPSFRAAREERADESVGAPGGPTRGSG